MAIQGGASSTARGAKGDQITNGDGVIGAALEACASAQWGEPVYVRTANNRSTWPPAPTDVDRASRPDESTGAACSPAHTPCVA